MYFVARLKDTPSNLLDGYVNDAIEKTNLTEVATKPLNELSHGFQQRVGIAQAIVHKPKVLILDEPIKGLDPMQIAEMRDLILSLKGEHTVLLSSHILSEVTKTCDRILVINQGKLIAEGSPAEIIGRGTDAIHFSCQVEGYRPQIRAELMAIEGLKIIDEEERKGVANIYFESLTDLRAEVARVLVTEGGGLLSLQKDEGELESLFLRLIKGDAK